LWQSIVPWIIIPVSLITLLFSVKIRIYLTYSLDTKGSPYTDLTLKLWKRINISVPEKIYENKVEKPKQPEKEAEKLLDMLDPIRDIIKKISKITKKRLTVDSAGLKIAVGTGDAALTGILTGALWAGVYGFLNLVKAMLRVNSSDVDIKPDFENEIFNMKINLIFSFRFIYIAQVLTAMKSSEIFKFK